jgi:hypothetical protein
MEQINSEIEDFILLECNGRSNRNKCDYSWFYYLEGLDVTKFLCPICKGNSCKITTYEKTLPIEKYNKKLEERRKKWKKEYEEYKKTDKYKLEIQISKVESQIKANEELQYELNHRLLNNKLRKYEDYKESMKYYQKRMKRFKKELIKLNNDLDKEKI